MHLKTRVEKLEQADSGKTCLLVNLPIGVETWEEAQIRFKREIAENPEAYTICVRFVKPGSSS